MSDQPRLFIIADNSRDAALLHPPKKAVEATRSLSVHVMYSLSKNLYAFNSNVEFADAQQLKKDVLKIRGVGSFLPLVTVNKHIEVRIEAEHPASVIGVIVKVIASNVHCADVHVMLTPGIELGVTSVSLVEFINEARFQGESMQYPPNRPK